MQESKPTRSRRIARVTLGGFGSVAVLGALAAITGSPFVFPSLGPTAYMLFDSPTKRAAAPRTVVLGHAIGLAVGYAALRLAVALSPAHGGLAPWPKALGAALSVGLTGGALALLGLEHAPALATTLIVSLGILATPVDLAIIELAVILLAGEGFVVNRLAGIPVPPWRPRSD